MLQIAAPVDDQSAKHPADVADQLERLSVEEASQMLHKLPAARAAQVLGEVQPDQRKKLVAELTNEQLSEVLKQMPHDQVADLLADTPDAQRAEMLAALPGRSQVVELLRYPEDSAGGIMSDRFITLDADQTVGEALQKVRGIADSDTNQSVTYLYVVDAEKRLVGVVPLRELVFRRPERRVREIMIPEVKHVWVDDDQETIARMFKHYHYLAVPVLDRDRKLVGTYKYCVNKDGKVYEVTTVSSISGADAAIRDTMKTWSGSATPGECLTNSAQALALSRGLT